jgi:hypothetical protein
MAAAEHTSARVTVTAVAGCLKWLLLITLAINELFTNSTYLVDFSKIVFLRMIHYYNRVFELLKLFFYFFIFSAR